ncbi:hypothetical protein AAC387_Pa02g1731 [Persea americana]
MDVVVRYVDKGGIVKERFLAIVHMVGTTTLSLKGAIDLLFSRHGLSLSRLHGQGYDGASNMQGEFNGLKTLIMRANEYAFYVHCFAHQRQLTLVAVAKNHIDIASLICLITSLVNVIGGSCKRRDILRTTRKPAFSGGQRPLVKVIVAAGKSFKGGHYGRRMARVYRRLVKVLVAVTDRRYFFCYGGPDHR